jgi:N-acetylglutamate synthase-like GNAT family acetyltransferase
VSVPHESTIRRATSADAEALSALALRSKAHWGYDADFMARVAPLLQLDPNTIERQQVYLLERAGTIVGHYRLSEIDGERFLDDLWIDPPFIGGGDGRRLWKHALETARALSWRELFIESDPGAEAFYLAMGARRIGVRRSPTGRDLPLLRFDLVGADRS